MEKNYWQIDENLYKVHITSDVYENLKDDFKKFVYEQQKKN